MDGAQTVVLLVNLGTPTDATASAVRTFLREFLSDKRVIDLSRFVWLPILYCFILPFRPAKVAKNYKLVWLRGAQYQRVVPNCGDVGVSPLLFYLYSLTNKLQQRYSEKSRVIVRPALRYGERNVSQALTTVEKEHPNVENVIVLPLFPQYSSTTTASIFDAVFEYYRNPLRRRIPSLFMVRDFCENETYIRSLGLSVLPFLKDLYHFDEKKGWAPHREDMERSLALVVSYHSIPVRYAETGDDYPARCTITTALVQRFLESVIGFSMDNILIQVYQSKFGKEPWLEPALDHTLETLPLSLDTATKREEKKKLAQQLQKPLFSTKVTKKVIVFAPSFAADCLETLEEIAVCGREEFIEHGGEFFAAVPCVNDSETFVDTIESVVSKFL